MATETPAQFIEVTQTEARRIVDSIIDTVRETLVPIEAMAIGNRPLNTAILPLNTVMRLRFIVATKRRQRIAGMETRCEINATATLTLQS